jgi:heme A synthase
MQAQVAGKAEMSVAEVLLLAVFAILRQADTGVKQSFAQKTLMKFIPPKSQTLTLIHHIKTLEINKGERIQDTHTDSAHPLLAHVGKAVCSVWCGGWCAEDEAILFYGGCPKEEERCR